MDQHYTNIGPVYSQAVFFVWKEIQKDKEIFSTSGLDLVPSATL